MSLKKYQRYVTLRGFMGIRMMEFGLAILSPSIVISELSHGAASVIVGKHALIWGALLFIAGSCLLVSSVLDWGLKSRKIAQRHVPFLRLLSHFRVAGYYLAGAVWLSFSYSAYVIFGAWSAELVGPTYLLFLVFLIFKDALKSQSRIKESGYALKRQVARQHQ